MLTVIVYQKQSDLLTVQNVNILKTYIDISRTVNPRKISNWKEISLDPLSECLDLSSLARCSFGYQFSQQICFNLSSDLK